MADIPKDAESRIEDILKVIIGEDGQLPVPESRIEEYLVYIAENGGIAIGEGLRGPMGPTGPTGEIGPTGPQGVQGIQGIQGVQGLRGETGPTGAKGKTGEAGPKGDTGAAGKDGKDGERGPIGPTGPEGKSIVGPTGEQGPKGDTGLIGPTGPTGRSIVGPTGETGKRGPEGPMGPMGPTGPQGPIGPAGKSAVLSTEIIVTNPIGSLEKDTVLPVDMNIEEIIRMMLTGSGNPVEPENPDEPIGPEYPDSGYKFFVGANNNFGAQYPDGFTPARQKAVVEEGRMRWINNIYAAQEGTYELVGGWYIILFAPVAFLEEQGTDDIEDIIKIYGFDDLQQRYVWVNVDNRGSSPREGRGSLMIDGIEYKYIAVMGRSWTSGAVSYKFVKVEKEV